MRRYKYNSFIIFSSSPPFALLRRCRGVAGASGIGRFRVTRASLRVEDHAPLPTGARAALDQSAVALVEVAPETQRSSGPEALVRGPHFPPSAPGRPFEKR